MRKIKFRQAIFHPITEEFTRWHYWGLIDGVFVGIDTGWYSPKQALENSYQYTGLKDKNGKEIFEGDIIRNDNYKYAHKVIYTLGSFKGKQLKGKFKGYADGMFFDRFEVIGNIYEHSHLLDNELQS